MTTTEDDEKSVQKNIDRYADERAEVIASGRVVSPHDGRVTVHVRRRPRSPKTSICFFEDMESEAKLADDILRRSLKYQSEHGLSRVGDANIIAGLAKTESVTRMSQNDAKAIHDVLLDTLPVATYALLREMFKTIGGRTLTDDTNDRKAVN